MSGMAPRHAFERKRLVRFAHCDPAGIIFFPQYLVLVNDLVEDWLGEGLGVPNAELILRRRIGTPTVSLQCDFSAVSRLGEHITLGLSVERIGAKSFTLRHGCRLGDEQRMSARQVLVCTDLDTHAAIAIPPDLRHALARFASSKDSDP
jgi:4-hydroxybenzoyl-CoA thioesterase